MFHNAGRPPQPFLLMRVWGSLETIELYSGSASPFDVFFSSFSFSMYYLAGIVPAQLSTLPTQKVAG